jgi:hypothetical protein
VSPSDEVGRRNVRAEKHGKLSVGIFCG